MGNQSKGRDCFPRIKFGVAKTTRWGLMSLLSHCDGATSGSARYQAKNSFFAGCSKMHEIARRLESEE